MPKIGTYVNFVQRNMTLAVHGRGQIGASTGLRLVGHCLRLVLLVDVRRVAALAVVLCSLREGVVAGRAIAGAVRRLRELSAGGSVGRLYLLLLMISPPRIIQKPCFQVIIMVLTG